jgi:hypothetical protein
MDHEVIYDPERMVNRVRRVVLPYSPFPWVVIRKGNPFEH